MEELTLAVQDGPRAGLPCTVVHTLVIGSGAAGLNAAVQLRGNGIDDVLVVTEGLAMGTSINTGSDKQTYYKLSLCGEEGDSPAAMARTYFEGGGMHGDLALVEASLSARAFLNLVSLGVPFPRERYGQFVGYKTDHDPRQRATSIGPYTSREMCRALIRQLRRLAVPVREGRTVVELLAGGQDGERRVMGAAALGPHGAWEGYLAENVVFAVGGPGGLYKTSVYPEAHTGAIGLALLAGAAARGLPESQYGLASTGFRWNVSGTYMQVVPRFVSTEADGRSGEREFLREYFGSAGEMNSQVFLKGYQWPFDARKVVGGSSLIDILVYIETVLRGRRVFLDFRANPETFSFDELSEEARDYLARSEALLATPLQRLLKMNPGAVELYREHGIDLAREPLEIAVCAQHNNGGLAGNLWWESENLRHLFPVGEVNGSHGVYRPGGSALNAGQAGSIRAAEYIANRCAAWTLRRPDAEKALAESVAALARWQAAGRAAGRTWREERDALRARMSRAGAHIRKPAELEAAVAEARAQWTRLAAEGCAASAGEEAETFRTRYLCFAHLVYLDAVRFALASGVGSRGSAVVLDAAGERVHDRLDAGWSIQPENPAFREKVQRTAASVDGAVRHAWVARRAVPDTEAWFETAWARFRSGAVYDG